MNIFDIPNVKKELQELETDTMAEGFWNDSKTSTITLNKIKAAKTKISKYEQLKQEIQDVLELVELLELETDTGLYKDILKSLKSINKSIESFEIELLLSGKYDNNNAIITIHSGAGGTESQDWAQMLYRMYLRWAMQNGYKTSELDMQAGEDAGIKSVSFEVQGQRAYGYLKSEIGVHRLVRISPFDSNDRRHTSFSSLEVLPEIESDDGVEIIPEDLKIDAFRASGAGRTKCK